MTLKAFLSNKSILCFLAILPLILLLICSQTTASDTKGIGVVIKDKSGRDVGLYKGSYALVIGASRYSAGWKRLPTIPNEVKTVKAALESQGFKVVMVLDPDSRGMKDAFESFIQEYGYESRNRLFFFFSGHGYTRKQGKYGYIVPVDAPDPRYDEV